VRQIIAIDPGPELCGLVLYGNGRVLMSHKAITVGDALAFLNDWRKPPHVALERVQSYGIAGGDLLRTAEVMGELRRRALDNGMTVSLHYRREVLQALDVTGKGGRDTLVRHRLIEMHGGTKALAIGKKADPGPLYGVTSHAWAALAVAKTAELELARS
jgi:hypothetical protein